jgi:hypothetical protein
MNNNFFHQVSVPAASGNSIPWTITTTVGGSGYIFVNPVWTHTYPQSFSGLWQKFVEENESLVAEDQKQYIIRSWESQTTTSDFVFKMVTNWSP